VTTAGALRNVVVRKSVRLFLLGVPTIAGLVFAVSPPAKASVPVYVKEAYASYRVGAPTIGLYDPVQQTTDGRLIIQSFTSAGHLLLMFNADTSKCVAASNSGDLAVVHPCNGGSGVVWIPHTGPDGVSCEFESQKFDNKYLAGDGSNGDQFHVKGLGASGWYYQFRILNQNGTEVRSCPPS